jgi:dipeptidyl aminopeptidase/acylaminoacyl peptidase
MIEVMRRESYPGSESIIERTLEAGENYGRFIASYLSEGNKIYGLLTVPWGLKPESGWPVILFNHGYVPPDEYRTTERYLDYIDYLASRGYIVFRSDYRGHGNSEGEAGGSYATPNYTIDVLNAMAAVKSYPDADPARIGMWGHSMGGHITLRAMVVSDEIKAGVIWGGVVGPYPDLFARSSISAAGADFTPRPTPASTRWPNRWRNSLFDTYGSPDENPAFWNSISANAYLDEISGPLQLHHATTDEVVPVAVSELLQRQMEAAGKPSELYLYDGDNHNIAVNFYTAMGRSLEFFDTYVKGAHP